MVGWRTASIRKAAEMPAVRYYCLKAALAFGENTYLFVDLLLLLLLLFSDLLFFYFTKSLVRLSLVVWHLM